MTMIMKAYLCIRVMKKMSTTMPEGVVVKIVAAWPQVLKFGFPLP